jgi:AraC-like DNA-binding protein
MSNVQRAESSRRFPSPALRPYIDRYIDYRLEGFPPGIHRGLPSRHLTFIISLGDPIEVAAMPGAGHSEGSYTGVVSGLHPGPALIRHNGTQIGVAIEATPLGARALFGMPAAALASTIVEPHEVLGPQTSSLPDRLASAASPNERFEILNHILSRSLRSETESSREVTHAWRVLVRTAGGVSVQAIADEVGWSRRHLAERFRDELGMSPKVAARVLRFDRARSSLSADTRASLVDVAVSAGYYDQAHFTHEFNEFAGCSPTRWMEEEFPSVQDGASGLPTD